MDDNGMTLSTAVAAGMGAAMARVMAPGLRSRHCRSVRTLSAIRPFWSSGWEWPQTPPPRVRAALEQRHFDVAELFAFICPARFAVPTPRASPAC